MANNKKTVAVEEETENEEYTQNLVYTLNININEGGSFNIHVYDGGKVKFNSGKPQPFPPPQG